MTTALLLVGREDERASYSTPRVFHRARTKRLQLANRRHYPPTGKLVCPSSSFLLSDPSGCRAIREGGYRQPFKWRSHGLAAGQGGWHVRPRGASPGRAPIQLRHKRPKPSAGGGLSLSLLNPHRGRTTAGDSPNAALRLSGVCEHGKSCNYFMALAVATENRHEFPSASSRSHRPECCGDHIFSSPGDNDAEDIGGRCLTITPDRQSCIKVLQGNLVSSVEQRIEES
jgi:hypothetical protein